RDHSGHAAKMPWTRFAAEPIAHAFDRYPGDGTLRIHLLDRWSEDQIYALALKDGAVVVEVSGISGEILVRPELRGVHKSRSRDYLRFRARSPNKREMSLMQRSHGRHQAHALGTSFCRTPFSHLRDRVN